MIKTNRYELYGFIVARDLYGGYGFKNLHIVTDKKGLLEIKNDPLQDYIKFGGVDVVYANLEVFKTEIEETEDAIIEKQYREPVDRIEKGFIPEQLKNSDYFWNALYEDEYTLIRY